MGTSAASEPPVLLRNPIFCDFQGGGGLDHLSPSGSAHVLEMHSGALVEC